MCRILGHHKSLCKQNEIVYFAKKLYCIYIKILCTSKQNSKSSYYIYQVEYYHTCDKYIHFTPNFNFKSKTGYGRSIKIFGGRMSCARIYLYMCKLICVKNLRIEIISIYKPKFIKKKFFLCCVIVIIFFFSYIYIFIF